MTNYAVNLPQTNFPMRANLPQREPQLVEFWQQIDLHEQLAQANRERGEFILHDGPPYANGEIHLGHALNKTLKDIVNKSRALEGYRVNYVPGWDCHGLPIELNVEKRFGKAGKEIARAQFIAECRKYAAAQIDSQKQGFRRLGIIGDWEHNYQTMTFSYEADMLRALATMVKRGYLIRGHKPVYWCLACGSALAEAEVEYRNKISSAIDISFQVVDPTPFQCSQLNIPIWTTTPWTLPANEAVTLHPRGRYCLVSCATLQQNFLILQELVAAVMERYGESDYQIIGERLGADFEGVMLQHPFVTDKVVPIILGEHVVDDMGTGAVHTAPAHGKEDHEIGLRYQLPVRSPLGADGRFNEEVPFLNGVKLEDADELIIRELKAAGKLLALQQLEHSYPHCWRHKTPLIFRATEQWFIDLDGAHGGKDSLREQALREIERVKWIPAQGKNSIASMVKQRPDWCISRQRSWGVPIALLIHRQNGAIHPEMARLIEEVIAPNFAQEGIDYWQNLDAPSFLRQNGLGADAEDYIKVEDVLDVWFDSGLTHYCVLDARAELSSPADVYLEGGDQYRGWFQSSLLTGVALNGEAPYRTVISHGFIVDATGHKMSKSLGNVVAPRDIIDRYGADLLRLWVAATDIHDDIAISDEILARTVDSYRIFRNAFRFLLGNLADFNPICDQVSPTEMLALDRWIVAQMLQLLHKGREDYLAYQLRGISGALQRFLVNEVSGFYFSVIKDRLYTLSPTHPARRSAQTALRCLLEIMVRLIAPILSFTAEEVWQELRRLEEQHAVTNRGMSVFLAQFDDLTWQNAFDLHEDPISAADWSQILCCRGVVNRALEELRAAGKIGSSLEAEVVLYAGGALGEALLKLGSELKWILITSAVKIVSLENAPAGALATELVDLKIDLQPSQARKCSRCWHYSSEVGVDPEHPELCARCLTNLFGEGEIRLMA